MTESIEITKTDKLEGTMAQLAENMNILSVAQGQSALQVKTMGEAIGVIGAEITGIKAKQSEFEVVQKNMSDDIDYLKKTQEVASYQKTNLVQAANARAHKVLQLPADKSEWSDKNHDDYTKYYSYFIHGLYSDAKRAGVMGNRVETTQRMFYEPFMRFIETWIPRQGVQGLKDYADKQRESKERIKKLTA